MKNELVWNEKYRPRKIKDCILPDRLKETFQAYVDAGYVPNHILCGRPGRGKTTVAKAMLEEIGSSYMFISPKELNLDALRTDIEQFATSMSLNGKRKYVIIDEADFLNPHIQPQLRTFMEVYSSTCGFILTCNYKEKLMEALVSRCPIIEFNFKKEEALDLTKKMLIHAFQILSAESVEYDKRVVAEVVKKYNLDFRRVINELQRYSVASMGRIDSGILVSFDNTTIGQLFGYMKNKEFTQIRKWVHESDYDEAELYRKLYDLSNEYLTNDSIPPLILLIAKYQYQGVFAPDKQLNMLAFFIEALVQLEFK